MDALRKSDVIKTLEVNKTFPREIKIGNVVYLVTSNFSGDRDLRELLIRAIERESAETKDHERNENPSR